MKNLNLRKQQSGAALAVGLVILLVMTLLGITSMNTTRTELKIAANIKNHSTAFQTAETATQRVLLDTATLWGDIDNIQNFSFAPTGKSYSAATQMQFEDCRNNPEGYSLEGDGVGDGTGGGNKAVIHNIRSVGTTSTAFGGEAIASSVVVVGIQTMLAGCTPPAP